MNRQAVQTLKTYFGYDTFREGQESVVESILEHRDVLAIMPTGAGKSICYQVPALMLSGITIVISPLISLMQDQVKALNEAGIHAAFINSSLSESQISKALYLAAGGRYKIIYVAPERLENYEFLEFARQVEISMVTVDEAHCISQWGQDFRPSYVKIVDFVKNLPGRPIVSAFTATATEEVKNDILCMNLIKGGGGNDREYGFTDKTRELLRQSSAAAHAAGKFDHLKGKPQSPSSIEKRVAKNTGKKRTEEQLANLSAGLQAYHAQVDPSVQQERGQRAAKTKLERGTNNGGRPKGIPMSDEQKLQQSLNTKGKPLSEDHKLNLKGPKLRATCLFCKSETVVGSLSRYHSTCV